MTNERTGELAHIIGREPTREESEWWERMTSSQREAVERAYNDIAPNEREAV